MASTVKIINAWIKNATRADVEEVLSKIILSERQKKIFNMFYLDRYNIGFIADSLCFSNTVISEELKTIRNKISVTFQ